jgi:hypothetical protein
MTEKKRFVLLLILLILSLCLLIYARGHVGQVEFSH